MNTKLTLLTLIEQINKENNSCVTVDVFAMQKGEREYLVTVRSSQKKVSRNRISRHKIEISASMSRRLMIEGVELAKRLHEVGIQMECPFSLFVQAEEG